MTRRCNPLRMAAFTDPIAEILRCTAPAIGKGDRCTVPARCKIVAPRPAARSVIACVVELTWNPPDSTILIKDINQVVHDVVTTGLGEIHVHREDLSGAGDRRASHIALVSPDRGHLLVGTQLRGECHFDVVGDTAAADHYPSKDRARQCNYRQRQHRRGNGGRRRTGRGTLNRLGGIAG
jgi:hypothetical protein